MLGHASCDLNCVPASQPGFAQSDEESALCYHVLGKVHGKWSPLPRTLKDYISSPKPNGYRSLHTTVLVGTQVTVLAAYNLPFTHAFTRHLCQSMQQTATLSY